VIWERVSTGLHFSFKEKQKLAKLREEATKHHEEEIDHHEDAIEELEEQIHNHKEKHKAKLDERDDD